MGILYSLLGTWLTHQVGRRLISLDYFQQKAEAEDRFSLMRFHENAEGIAFYRGESDEKRELVERFGSIVINWKAIMSVTRNLTWFTSGFGQIALKVPLAITAPAYFAGTMPLGVMFQASNAFVELHTALSWIVENYVGLAAWGATVERLEGFTRTVALAQSPRQSPSSMLAI